MKSIVLLASNLKEEAASRHTAEVQHFNQIVKSALDGIILPLVVGVNALPNVRSRRVHLRRRKLVAFARCVDNEFDIEVRLSVVRFAPDRTVDIIVCVVRRGLDFQVNRCVVGGESAAGVDFRAAGVTHGRHHQAAGAAEVAHTPVKFRAAVVRADFSAEAHVQHPRLAVVLGVILDSLGLFQHAAVGKVRRNQDEVGIGGEAVVVRARHLAAGGDVGHVCGVSHIVAAVSGGPARSQRARSGACAVAYHAIRECRVCIFKALVDDTDHDSLAGERRFQPFAFRNLRYASFVACLGQSGVQLL